MSQFLPIPRPIPCYKSLVRRRQLLQRLRRPFFTEIEDHVYSISLKEQTCSIRRPERQRSTFGTVETDLAEICTIGVYRPDLVTTSSIRSKCDFLSVRRPARVTIEELVFLCSTQESHHKTSSIGRQFGANHSIITARYRERFANDPATTSGIAATIAKTEKANTCFG